MIKQVYMQRADTLGTTVELRLVCKSASEAEQLFSTLWKKIADFDNRFSRFKADSDLSTFNHQAGAKVQISDEFKRLLKKVQYFSILTQGVFNPFILPALQRAGYIHSMVSSANRAPDFSQRKVVGCEHLEVGDSWARIPAHTALDLGGIGKGYLADQLAMFLDDYSKDYCLSFGGDIRVSGREPGGPWIIDVQSAEDRAYNSALYTGTQTVFGIATSGVVRTTPSKTQGHLIDTHTGMPVPSSSRICTVVADDATTADVLASCILIEGEHMARRLFKSQHIHAVLLQGGGNSDPCMLGEGFTLVEDQPAVDAYNQTASHV